MNLRSLAFRSILAILPVAVLPSSVSAQVLSVSPTSVSSTAAQGQNAPSKSVTVKNTDKRKMRWSISSKTGTFFSVSPTTGGNSNTVTVSFQSATLGVGSYSGSFTVNADPAGSQTVSVALTVTTPPPPAPAKLAVSCPANVTVASPDGSAVAVTYPAPTTSGGVSPVNVSSSPASGSMFPVGTTAVQASATSSDGQTANCSFSVGVTYTAPPPPPPPAPPTKLVVSCPANVTATSSNGSDVAVTYPMPTASGGVAPYNMSNNPGSGALFAVGTTTVQGYASSSDGQTANCSFSVTVTSGAPAPPPPPSPTGVGQQSTITCPAGAVDIWPGAGIQTIVNNYGNNTTFCIRAGINYLTSSITPKTGDVFVGEYGAILDGSRWTTSDDTQAAFRAHNQDIDYVTIRNIVIRNMPQRGIHAYYYMSDHWTVEYNEIASSKNLGIVFPGDSIVRNNYIHDNSYGGYMADYSHRATLEANEIANNGTQQKVSESDGVTFRNNYVHNNAGAGIWFDSDNTNTLIEGNRLEDNASNSIWFEIGSGAIIRNNTIKRSGDTAIFISTSKNADVYGNILDSNFRGITYFLNCPSVGGGVINFDLANNSSHDNSITVGTQVYPLASAFNFSNCSTTQVAPYLNGQKNLTFTNNSYKVPSTNGQYWYWSDFKYWSQWQGLPQDASGTVQ